MKDRQVTVPGSHGAKDLTLTVHAPAVELTDNAGGTVTIGPHQIARLTDELIDLDTFFATGDA